MNKHLRNFIDRSPLIYAFAVLLCAAVTAIFAVTRLDGTVSGDDLLFIAELEAGFAVVLFVLMVVIRKRLEKKLEAYIESVAYDSQSAQSSTLANFPLPIAVFRIDDTKLVWGNEMFFEIIGSKGKRLDARMSDLVDSFSGKWLLEGKRQYPPLVELGERKYRIRGNIIRNDSAADDAGFMGISYWVDVTDYENVKTELEQTQPVACIIIVDNLEDLYKNQTDRVKNDIRDSIEDALRAWVQEYNGFVRRYDRDRYIAFFQQCDFDAMRDAKFSINEKMHSVGNPSGISASISLGFGEGASGFPDALQSADMAADLAYTRGGDQAVVRNRLSFEFYGGRGSEVEKRTKVKSRVMANTLDELIRDSSRVFVMGHKYADFDSIGAAVGVCALARKHGIRYNIVIDETSTAADSLVSLLKSDGDYKNVFISGDDAVLHADGRSLLVVVDANRPEQVEASDLLDACNRVAIVDHHRVSSTYIQNAALGFIEPYASSACELMSEVLQETTLAGEVSKVEANALFSGIVLDTKNFTIRTGERTFDAASWLRRVGADTTEVKKLLQSGIDDTIAKYTILQGAELYRNIAISAPGDAYNRVIVAKAADELLNISGVEASIVVASGEDGEVFASARSIGEVNVQIIMEKLGGGGNRSAAAIRFSGIDVSEARSKVIEAIDDYFDN